MTATPARARASADAPAGGYRAIDVGERERDVEYSQHLLLRRVGVATGVGAGRLVGDRRDDAELAVAALVAEDPGAESGRELRHRTTGVVAAVAGLALLIDARADERAIGRIDDLALLVVDADLLEAVLAADLLDDAMHHLALVEQHRLPGPIADGVGEDQRLAFDQRGELTFVSAAGEPGGSAEDGQRHQADGDHDALGDSGLHGFPELVGVSPGVTGTRTGISFPDPKAAREGSPVRALEALQVSESYANVRCTAPEQESCQGVSTGDSSAIPKSGAGDSTTSTCHGLRRGAASQHPAGVARPLPQGVAEALSASHRAICPYTSRRLSRSRWFMP